jgi:hypothetical protein
VVRDQVLGFSHQFSELADAPIARRQLTENAPAQWICEQLQKLKGRFVDTCRDHNSDNISIWIDVSSGIDGPARGE